MEMRKNLPALNVLEERGRRGSAPDVDFLMEWLEDCVTVMECKRIDFALGLVRRSDGLIRVRHFLFNGTSIQRNYAALYFKRLGLTELLQDAVEAGLIDMVQAFSK